MLAFSQRLNQSLERAATIAERLPQDVTSAHLLLALTDDPDAAPVMQACNVDLQQLRSAILASIPAAGSAAPPDGTSSRFSQGFQADLERASVHVQSTGRQEINGADVLVAMLAGPAAGFLQAQGMTRYDATTFISHGITKDAQAAPSASEVAAQASSAGPAGSAMSSVRLVNDEFTPMEFVVHVLTKVFGLEHDDAIRVMLQIHHQGAGVCGTYASDVAKAKAAELMELARQHQQPLRCYCKEA